MSLLQLRKMDDLLHIVVILIYNLYTNIDTYFYGNRIEPSTVFITFVID